MHAGADGRKERKRRALRQNIKKTLSQVSPAGYFMSAFDRYSANLPAAATKNVRVA